MSWEVVETWPHFLNSLHFRPQMLMQEMVTWPIPGGRSGPAWDIMSLTALRMCQESTEAV